MSDTGGPGPGGPGAGRPSDPSLEPAHDDDPEPGRPSWLLPAGLGLAVGAVIAAVVLLVTQDDSTDSTSAPATDTTAPEPTGPDTTNEPAATTTAPDSTGPETTTPDTTTPDTTPDTSPDSSPDTRPPESEPVPPADPGTVRIDGRSFPILRSCLTVPLAPNTADLQVTSHLFEIDERPGIVERWFDEGGVSGGTYREGRTTFGTGDVFDLEAGFALEVPREGSDGLVVANPEQPPPDCGTDNLIQTFEASTPEFTYTHTVLDACAVETDGGRAAGSAMHPISRRSTQRRPMARRRLSRSTRRSRSPGPTQTRRSWSTGRRPRSARSSATRTSRSSSTTRSCAPAPTSTWPSRAWRVFLPGGAARGASRQTGPGGIRSAG